MADQTGAVADKPAETPDADAPKKDTNRDYVISTELELDLSSAAGEKQAIETLKKHARDGKITVAARTGRAMGFNQRKALETLAGVVPLNGDYDVVAASATKRFVNVKTETRPTLSIG
jgi:hypothetical protein